MAPRASWKGFVRLSLVSVPVKAFTANNTGEEIRLNQLHKDCHQRVRYRKVCPEHGELKSDEIVSGYEYAKDQYVIIDPAEVAKLRAESDKTVRIDGFVDAGEIDPVQLAGKTYYLLPDGVAGNKPYALLCEGMKKAGVVAVAQMVIAGRDQLAMLRADDGLLAMTILHYAKKMKAAAPFRDELGEQETTKEELKLTSTLIDASTFETFDLDSYKDDYVEKLTQLIQMKVDGKEVVEVTEREEPKIINLMEALKKSVAEAEARKMAPSVKKPARKKAAKKAKRTTKKKKTG